MLLIAGVGNEGQDQLLTAEVTVSSPTIAPAITTSSPTITISATIPSSSTAATSSKFDTQDKIKSNYKHTVNK